MVPLVQRLEQDVEGLEAYTSTGAGTGRGTSSARDVRSKEKLKAATGRIKSVMAAVQRVTDAEKLPHPEDNDDAQVPFSPHLPPSRVPSAPSRVRSVV
jgi:hypothetical protein